MRNDSSKESLLYCTVLRYQIKIQRKFTFDFFSTTHFEIDGMFKNFKKWNLWNDSGKESLLKLLHIRLRKKKSIFLR